MKRKFSWHIYIGAFFITLALFMVGFYLGNQYQRKVYYSFENYMNEINEKTNDLLLLIISQDSEYFCELYDSKIAKLDEDTFQLGEKLEFMETKKGISDPKMKAKYFDLEFRDYMFTKKANERCENKIVIMIYFYKNPNCEMCKKEGYEISKFRKEYYKKGKIIRIYTFDGNLDESIIAKIMKNKYEIKKYPTMVIIYGENRVKLEGYYDWQELMINVKNVTGAI